VLERVAGAGSVALDDGPEAGWLTVRIDPHRSAELNRALAGGGVYASRIEGGTTLESLFLELTGSRPDVGGAGSGGTLAGGLPPPPPPAGEPRSAPGSMEWRS
jgi:hypothetical protein